MPAAGSILEFLEQAPPANLAVEDGGEELSYAQLVDRATRAAGWVAERLGQGGFVVVKAQPTAQFVATCLGVLYSGNTPIPVDPDIPAGAVDFIARRSAAAGVVAPLTNEDLVGVRPLRAPRAERPALVMFTSGTTGTPKGAIISHANLVHSCTTVASYLEYARHRSAAVALPLHYSYALLSQVFAMLMVGGSVHLFRDLRNPLKFAARVEARGIATFCGVPSTFHALCAFNELKTLRLPAVRVLCSAGAAMDSSRFATVKAIFPNAVFFNNYGMTEAAPRIAFIRDDDPRFAQPTCGRPMAGVEVRVVDPVTHAALPDGEAGMLVVKGPNITSGYLNDDEATRAAFTPDGYLISGDIAYLDQGYIFIKGRHDDVFNSGGEKVAPLEIEHVLNQIPGVDLSAVAGLPDEARGAVPVAFLRLTAPVSRQALVAVLSAALPKSKVPQRYYQVHAFPMTSNGKLQRKALAVDASSFVVQEIV